MQFWRGWSVKHAVALLLVVALVIAVARRFADWAATPWISAAVNVAALFLASWALMVFVRVTRTVARRSGGTGEGPDEHPSWVRALLGVVFVVLLLAVAWAVVIGLFVSGVSAWGSDYAGKQIGLSIALAPIAIAGTAFLAWAWRRRVPVRRLRHRQDRS